MSSSISKLDFGKYFKKKNTCGGIDKKIFNNSYNKKALDFGCGSGFVSIELAKNGFMVIAYDIDPECQKNFFNLSKEIKDKIDFHTGELNLFNSYDQYFDIIICREVFEHVPDRIELLKLFKKILSPNGLLIISVPTSRSEKIFLNFDPQWLEKSEHTTILDENQLEQSFANTGFSISNIENTGFQWSILWLILAPFKTAHRMENFISNNFLTRFALHVSKLITNIPFIENIGNHLFPKSHVYYLRHQKPIILTIHDYDYWILGKWSNEIKKLYSDRYEVYSLEMDKAFTNKKLMQKLVQHVDLVLLLLPHPFDFFYNICPDKIVCTVHHWVKFTKMYSDAITLSKYIVTGANEWREKILDKHPDATVYLVHSGFDDSFSSFDKCYTNNNRLTIGFFAKNTSNEFDRKGTRHLLEIISLLIEKNLIQFYSFIITGEGWHDHVERIRKLGVNITYRPNLSPEEMPSMYRMLDIYLILSDIEGGPATLAESLISGVIPLTTRVGAALDFIEDGKNGFFIENTDYNNIIDKLEFLRKNFAIRKQISLSAFSYAENNLSYKKTFLNFNKVFSDAISIGNIGQNSLHKFLSLYNKIQ